MIDQTLPILIRPATTDDYGYILASWSRELHKTTPYNFIPNPIFFPHQRKVINQLLGTSQVTVACIDDSPNDIVGYLVAQPYDQQNLIVHWAGVKGIYRRLGVLKELLHPYDYQSKNLICSHYFNLFKTLRDRYHLIFDPTALEAA
jgi:hypothetical protein